MATDKPIKLWISPATSSFPPHVLLRLSGIPYEIQTIQMEHFPPELYKINPKGRVPVIEFPDGSILTETVAIMTWIDRTAPGKDLFGKTPLQQARSYEWFNWLSGKVHEHGFGAVFTPHWFSADESAHPGIKKKGEELLDTSFGQIEGRLSGEHAVEDVFTAVDLFLYVIFRWGYLMEIDMKSKYPNWNRLAEGVKKNPEVIATCKAEGIELEF